MATVRVEERGLARWIVMDRPDARNAFSRALVDDLRAAVADARSARLVAITGAGDKAFSAGADLKERKGMSREETVRFLGDLNSLMNEVAALPGLTVAAVNGAAFGGGLELALACDVRVAAATAQLGLTEVTLGIIPGAGGTQRLARLVGPARAKELIALGRRMTAAEALRFGVVGEVGDLGAIVARFAEEIARAAPLAVAAAKRAIDEGAHLALADGLAVERRCYESTLATEDRAEGLAAFAEKRPPRFTGR